MAPGRPPPFFFSVADQTLRSSFYCSIPLRWLSRQRSLLQVPLVVTLLGRSCPPPLWVLRLRSIAWAPSTFSFLRLPWRSTSFMYVLGALYSTCCSHSVSRSGPQRAQYLRYKPFVAVHLPRLLLNPNHIVIWRRFAAWLSRVQVNGRPARYVSQAQRPLHASHSLRPSQQLRREALPFRCSSDHSFNDPVNQRFSRLTPRACPEEESSFNKPSSTQESVKPAA